MGLLVGGGAMGMRGMEVPDEPKETFSCDVFLGLQLIQDERLESF
jgi:hypothetical protein